MQQRRSSRVKDGVLMHPTDFEAWKTFDARYMDFFVDPYQLMLLNCLNMGHVTLYSQLNLLCIIFPMDVDEATLLHRAIVDSVSYVSG